MKNFILSLMTAVLLIFAASVNVTASEEAEKKLLKQLMQKK